MENSPGAVRGSGPGLEFPTRVGGFTADEGAHGRQVRRRAPARVGGSAADEGRPAGREAEGGRSEGLYAQAKETLKSSTAKVPEPFS